MHTSPPEILFSIDFMGPDSLFFSLSPLRAENNAVHLQPKKPQEV